MKTMDTMMQIIILWMYVMDIALGQATKEEPTFVSLDDDTLDLAMVMENGHLAYHIWQDKIEAIEAAEKNKSQYTEPPEDIIEDDVRNDTRTKRFVMDKENRRWTHGIIPYLFDDSVDQRTRQHIRNDIFGLFEFWTHFRFVPWNSSVPVLYNLDHNNYLNFVAHGNRCWSYVGNTRQNGQRISCCIQDRCIHEIGHSLGFYHELESPLRDDYIRINKDNIVEGMSVNFYKSTSQGKKVFGYYDMSTVMGYAPNSFSKNLRPTITVLDPESTYLTLRKDMSAYYMFYEAQSVYNMKAEKCPSVLDECMNGGYLSYVNGTCRCRCPQGLDYATNCATVIGSDTCGGVFELTKDQTRVTITSDRYPTPYRVTQPCTWFVKGPPGSKLAADFEGFQIPKINQACPTYLEIRYAMPGQPGVKYCGVGFSKTIVSQHEYLSFHLDTSMLDAYATFSVSVALTEAEDMCYTTKDNGRSYRDRVNYSRDYQPCLPWDRVQHCPINTFSVQSMELESNYCRNPGHGTEPWCYVNADNCQRAYCDVCNLRKCRDVFDNCEWEMFRNPFYCFINTEARRGCRKTCKMCTNYSRHVKSVQCIPPASRVTDGVLVEDNRTFYNVGDTVTYTCTQGSNNGTANSTCTTGGTWTHVGYVCNENPLCQDKRSDCGQLLNRNPTMCRTYREFAVKQCAYTCGICNNTINKVECYSDWYMMGYVTEISEGPYYVGDIVTFKCYNDYSLVVGDVQRACQRNGEFTGIEPRCAAIEDTVSDLYHVSIRRRSHTVKPNTAYMLSNSYYRIQRRGEIIAWEYYSLYRGQVYFQVWRQAGSSNIFKLLSSFHVADTNDDRMSTVYVPLQQRVNVEPGDFIGIFLPEEDAGGIMYDKCKTQYDPNGGDHLSLSYTGSNTVGQYYRMEPSNECYLLSVSAKIGPVRKVDIQALRLSWTRFLNRLG